METPFGMYVILGHEKLIFCFSGTFLKKKNRMREGNVFIVSDFFLLSQ